METCVESSPQVPPRASLKKLFPSAIEIIEKPNSHTSSDQDSTQRVTASLPSERSCVIPATVPKLFAFFDQFARF